MVRSVGIVRNYRVDFVVVALYENGQVFTKPFLDVFGLFFPYKAILLMPSYEFKQRSLFLVAQAVKSLYFSSQFSFIHGD